MLRIPIKHSNHSVLTDPNGTAVYPSNGTTPVRNAVQIQGTVTASPTVTSAQVHPPFSSPSDTTDLAEKSNGASDKTHTWIYIAAAATATLLLIVLIGLFFYCGICRRQENGEN